MYFIVMSIPLPVILRPKSLDEIVGQRHILGENGTLRRIIESDGLKSMILYGPAGTGKTTIAEVISNITKSLFVKLNATSAKVADIRKEGEKAKNQQKLASNSTVMFLDELHRFTRTQSEVLLPYVEDGTIIFIGATTENPYHSIVSPLISRSIVFQLEPLGQKDLAQLIVKAVKYYKNDGKSIRIDKEAVKHFIIMACGDGRKVLSLLELAVAIDDHITLDVARAVAPSKYVYFGPDQHFDMASAYQGAIQASDPDAAVFWLAKWLESGEDPRYIARRMLVSAGEDACSTPICTAVAHAAYVAACDVGRPECDILLSQATVLIATACRDKSAANAIWSALADVKSREDVAVPKEMRDSHYNGAKNLGHGAYKDGGDQSSYVGVSKKYYYPIGESK